MGPASLDTEPSNHTAALPGSPAWGGTALDAQSQEVAGRLSVMGQELLGGWPAYLVPTRGALCTQAQLHSHAQAHAQLHNARRLTKPCFNPCVSNLTAPPPPPPPGTLSVPACPPKNRAAFGFPSGMPQAWACEPPVQERMPPRWAAGVLVLFNVLPLGFHAPKPCM